jgi:hypothetical protein
MPSDGNLAIRLNTTVNTIMVSNGRISAQDAPMIVCL